MAEDLSSSNYTSSSSSPKTEVKNDNTKTNDQITTPKEVISNVEANLSTEESSLINAIINELGGKELRT